MKILTIAVFLAGLAVSNIAAAPASTKFPNALAVRYYPKALPAGSYPGAALESRAAKLKRRDNSPVLIDVSTPYPNGTKTTAAVFACKNADYSGFCLSILSDPGQCGQCFIFSPISCNSDALHQEGFLNMIIIS